LGRERRRLEDDGVAGHQRRRDLPGGDSDREVPGGDQRGYAERLLDRVAEVVGQFERDGLAVEPPPVRAAELNDIDGALQLAARLDEDLALLAGQRAGDLLLAL